jgi:hypothetical protein
MRPQKNSDLSTIFVSTLFMGSRVLNAARRPAGPRPGLG